MDNAEQIPRTLGRYRLLARIASGGMGAVYLARASGELGFTRNVAVKVLHAHLAEDDRTLARFLAEARVASKLVHPHVVTVLDVVSADAGMFIVLEYVHGESLSGLLRAAERRNMRLPLRVVSAIAIGMLEGLHAAHEARDDDGTPLGVVHRDVSPHNVLVSSSGGVYVTDFGIAKLLDHARVTGTGEMLGKAGYMAPEQILGSEISRATDLYASGIVIWEMLAGRHRFAGLEEQLAATLVTPTHTPPSALRADETIPEGLDELVLSMLAREPAKRPRTALEAARALARIVPPAADDEVAEIVRDLAAAKLQRLDEAARASHHDATMTLAPAPPADGTFATMTTTGTRWRRRAQVSFGVAAGAVILSGAFAIAFANLRPPAPESAAASAPPAAAPSAGVGSSSAPLPAPPVAASATDPAAAEPVVPSASSDAINPSAPNVAINPSAASASSKPARRVGPTPKKPAVDCSTPYEVTNGIKRYRRECFPERTTK